MEGGESTSSAADGQYQDLVFSKEELDGIVNPEVVQINATDTIRPNVTLGEQSSDYDDDSVSIGITDTESPEPGHVNARTRTNMSPSQKLAKLQRDRFVRMSKGLLKSAQRLKEGSGCNLYLKAQLKTATGLKTIVEGTNFQLLGQEASPTKGISTQQISLVVANTLKEEVVPVLEDLKRQNFAVASTLGNRISPRKRIAIATKADCCWICRCSTYTRDYMPYASTWLVCSGDGKPCSMSVHAHCLGFPDLSNKEVDKLPDIYCQQHMGFGIAKKALATEESNDDLDPSNPKSKQTAGKRGSSRRGRPKKN